MHACMHACMHASQWMSLAPPPDTPTGCTQGAAHLQASQLWTKKIGFQELKVQNIVSDPVGVPGGRGRHVNAQAAVGAVVEAPQHVTPLSGHTRRRGQMYTTSYTPSWPPAPHQPVDSLLKPADGTAQELPTMSTSLANRSRRHQKHTQAGEGPSKAPQGDGAPRRATVPVHGTARAELLRHRGTIAAAVRGRVGIACSGDDHHRHASRKPSHSLLMQHKEGASSDTSIEAVSACFC